jgi:energy-coupling factor transporter ATP-binding protein EcfA2
MSLIQRVQAVRPAADQLQHWLDQEAVAPGSDADRSQLSSDIAAVYLSLDKLEAEPSVLTIVFLGGTGVGKSTLLNALSGTRIAQAGLKRPTTQFPTLYHHRDVDIDALPGPFKTCKTAAHEREELRRKILVDTPDIDGSVEEHHERLKEILPVADAILYVGSAEKYHDRAAWNLLLEHAPHRAFAFVLNKWDRCLAAQDETTGRSPDHDMRESLRQAGFVAPILFRLSSRQWEARRVDGKADIDMVPDDFAALLSWIERELDERTIRDIKARGFAEDLGKLTETLGRLIPPDWTKKREQLETRWLEALRSGVQDQTDLLVEATDRQAESFERHFSHLGREKIGGIFGVYLHLVDRLRNLRGSLFPMPTAPAAKTEMQSMASRCVQSLPANTRRSQRDALRDRLLTLASRDGWNIDALAKGLEAEESQRPLADLTEASLAQILTSELESLESDYADPRGSTRAVHTGVRWLATWLPGIVLTVIVLRLIYDFIQVDLWGIGEFFSATLLFGATMAGLHFLLVRVFPVKWTALRQKMKQRLEERILAELAPRILTTLDGYTKAVQEQRQTLVAVKTVLDSVRDQLQRSTSEPSSPLFARSKPGTS